REIEQSAMKFGKIGVKDRTSTALGLGGLYGTFGEQLGGGQGAARILTNRLARSADVGNFDPDAVTPYLGMLGETFKASGYKDTDMFAGLTLASKSNMSAETFTTALRNLTLITMQLKAEGKVA